MDPDGFFELFNILCATFSEGRLRLAVPLLPLFRCRIYLRRLVSISVDLAPLCGWSVKGPASV
jgi:hypothetical protein